MYRDIKEQLEDMLFECARDGITPKEVDMVKDLVVSIYKLNGILMADEYGRDYYGARRTARSMGRYRGHNSEMVKQLEEKMAHLSGDEQDVMRRAINILER